MLEERIGEGDGRQKHRPALVVRIAVVHRHQAARFRTDKRVPRHPLGELAVEADNSAFNILRLVAAQERER